MQGCQLGVENVLLVRLSSRSALVRTTNCGELLNGLFCMSEPVKEGEVGPIASESRLNVSTNCG